MFCAEGDNAEEAIGLANRLNRWLNLIMFHVSIHCTLTAVYSDRRAYENNVDPDQTAQLGYALFVQDCENTMPNLFHFPEDK